MLFEIGGTPIPVRWYRATPSALAFPEPHAFFSRDWEDDKGNDRIGEQRPPRGQWDAGMRPAALKGDGLFQGTIEKFQEGVSPGEINEAVLSCALEPAPCVCGDGPFDSPPGPEELFPIWHLQCGGVRWATSTCGVLEGVSVVPFGSECGSFFPDVCGIEGPSLRTLHCRLVGLVLLGEGTLQWDGVLQRWEGTFAVVIGMVAYTATVRLQLPLQDDSCTLSFDGVCFTDQGSLFDFSCAPFALSAAVDYSGGHCPGHPVSGAGFTCQFSQGP